MERHQWLAGNYVVVFANVKPDARSSGIRSPRELGNLSDLPIVQTGQSAAYGSRNRTLEVGSRRLDKSALGATNRFELPIGSAVVEDLLCKRKSASRSCLISCLQDGTRQSQGATPQIRRCLRVSSQHCQHIHHFQRRPDRTADWLAAICDDTGGLDTEASGNELNPR
jgi:hypothetical protein